jgi:hypothetical protein
VAAATTMALEPVAVLAVLAVLAAVAAVAPTSMMRFHSRVCRHLSQASAQTK